MTCRHEKVLDKQVRSRRNSEKAPRGLLVLALGKIDTQQSSSFRKESRPPTSSYNRGKAGLWARGVTESSSRGNPGWKGATNQPACPIHRCWGPAPLNLGENPPARPPVTNRWCCAIVRRSRELLVATSVAARQPPVRRQSLFTGLAAGRMPTAPARGHPQT
jgi:hypothetical protein